MQFQSSDVAAPTYAGDPTRVYPISNLTSENFLKGREKACVTISDEPESVLVLIDSSDRLPQSKSSTDFSVSMGGNLYRGRKIKVARVDFPKPPNITQYNNIFVFKIREAVVGEVVITFQIPSGWYNHKTFSEALSFYLTESLHSSFVGADDYYFVVNMTQFTRSFNISIKSPPVPLLSFSFFMCDENSGNTYAKYMDNFAFFHTFPSATTVPLNSFTLHSSAAPMIFTRYYTLHSSTLNQFSSASSKTSSNSAFNKMIAVVPVSDAYIPSDFESDRVFSLLFGSVDLDDAPVLNICNTQKSLTSTLDILLLDEYDHDVASLFKIRLGATEGYSTHSPGITFWLKVYF